MGINEKAAFSCEVADPELQGIWMRNGKKVTEDDRVKIIAEGTSRQLRVRKNYSFSMLFS